MIPGIRGSLLSEEALERALSGRLHGLLDEGNRAGAQRRLRAWHAPLERMFGPATAARTVFDRIVTPLLAHLGYRVTTDDVSTAAPTATTASLHGRLDFRRAPVAAFIVTPWGNDPDSAWRDAVRAGLADRLRWILCCNGPALRVVDAHRTYSRRFVEFNLEASFEHSKTFAVFWGLLRAASMQPDDRGRSLLDRAVELSDAYRSAVRASLQQGVHEALGYLIAGFASARGGRRRVRQSDGRRPSGDVQRDPAAAFNEALVVIYRILFLLFAEARGLVPQWHPTYRDGYTIESLRPPIETLPRPRGLWETLQAIARLAHRGCRIGALHVTPFNGHLFSPADSPLADALSLDDAVVRQAMLALTTRPGRSGRERIGYDELGVEQLGGVYERVLEFEPSGTLARSERRRTTGSFYTPRPLTEFLVRRTLAPLVRDASPEAILRLRVLDPAMGSGAFLVAACRYLASAYESALIRDGELEAEAIGERERAGFRRLVAQRCLYGVDINPMAVQLGRLSIWLTTLAADRPLTFLDHRLRAGNSLVGASMEDLRRRPGRTASVRTAPLPLFDDDVVRDEAIRDAVETRVAIAIEPGDTLAQVRAKEQALARVQTSAPLSRWREACDVWCAEWFTDHEDRRRWVPFDPLVDAVFGRGSLPHHIVEPALDRARQIAVRERFFHWSIEFPEVFDVNSDGLDRPPGFDAVLGNPPWEMLRGDRGDENSRQAARSAAARLTEFTRQSGVYRAQGNGHANLYQLFLERMLSLVRRGGRLGVILPAGWAVDHGGARLRRATLDSAGIDTLVAVENRDGVFPIHRGLRFLLLAATRGEPSDGIPCRFGIRRPEALDDIADTGIDPVAVVVPRSLIARTSGDQMAIPDVRAATDLDILNQIAFSVPALGDANGWNLHFGRELNASDDRRHFHDAQAGPGLPIVEGKQVTPFAVDIDRAPMRIDRSVAARLLDPSRSFDRERLAYRDVASATNRLTLIAAVIPAGALTTHTLFCSREALDEDDRYYLCGMFNSLVANYLVRLRVTTHVTTTIIERLPMPARARHAQDCRDVVALSAAMCIDGVDAEKLTRLQATAAHLYGLDRSQFARVLDTFPLVPRADRDRAMAAFCDIVARHARNGERPAPDTSTPDKAYKEVK